MSDDRRSELADDTGNNVTRNISATDTIYFNTNHIL